MIFHDITIAAGRRFSTRRHDSTKLVREAVQVFARLLREKGADFRMSVPVDFARHIELDWISSNSSSTVSFWVHGEPATSSALVSGRDPDFDREMLQLLQDTVDKKFAELPGGADLDVAFAPERPLIITVMLVAPDISPADYSLIGDMETCLAAAFFEQVERGDT